MAVWPWGALYLLRASLSSLQSLGVTTHPMEQHEKKRISAGYGSQGACWPGGRGPVASGPAPPFPASHPSLVSKPWAEQHWLAFHILGWAQGSNWDTWPSWLPAQL